MTNRFIHDTRTGWKCDLNYAFIQGFRFDIALYRCRKIGISGLPEYAEHIKQILDLKEKHARFFYNRETKYVCETELNLPDSVGCCEYRLGDDRMFALCNYTEKEVTVKVLGTDITLAPCGIACVEK